MTKLWKSLDDAMDDELFHQVRAIMGTTSMGQDDALRRAINRVVETRFTPNPALALKSEFLVKTNTECRAWMESFWSPEVIEEKYLTTLWAWQEQERRLGCRFLPKEKAE